MRAHASPISPSLALAYLMISTVPTLTAGSIAVKDGGKQGRDQSAESLRDGSATRVRLATASHSHIYLVFAYY